MMAIYNTRPIYACLGLLIASLLTPSRTAAQDTPYVALDDPIVRFISPLLLEGMGADSEPVSWPLPQQTLRSWMNVGQDVHSSDWMTETMARVSDRLPPALSESTSISTLARTGIRLSTQDRRDLLYWQDADEISWQPMLQTTTWLKAGSWTAALGLRFDRYYEIDPDGLDAVHRWLSRSENAFLARNGEHVSFFLGRAARHWGEVGRDALILSDNARPFDHMALRFGSGRLQLETVLGELDSFTGDRRATGYAGADSVRSGSIRRYLSAHRLSLRATERWTIGLSHATLYSGPGSSISLKFLNPFNVALWEVDNRPKNEENNGMVGGFLHYRGPLSRARFELLLDDVDVLNGNEPASIAASLSGERLLARGAWHVSAHATLVSGRTYNAEQAPGRFIFLDRGLGTERSDFLRFGASASWLKWSGWLIRPGFEFLLQGDQDMRGPLPNNEDAPFMLSGTPERVFRPYLAVDALMASGLDLSLNLGYIQLNDHLHAEGVSISEITASISIAYRLTGKRALK